MKIAKFAFAAVVVAGGIVAAFAFTTPSKKVLDKWYGFTGTAVRADFENPAKYVLLSEEPVNEPGTATIQAIHVDNSTEVYTTGVNAGKPKVDVGSLNADILNATGISDGTKNEITNRVFLKD